MGLGINEIIGDKSQEILSLASKYGVEDVRVFGSVVRGEASADSDIDLLLNVRNAKFFDMLHFKYAAEELLGRKVDVVSDNALNPKIAEFVLSEAIPLSMEELDG